MKPGFSPSDIDPGRPHPARMYNFYLGGKDNYPVDRAAARQVLHAAPEGRDIARANRAFLQRVVRFLVGEAGIRQIIDIGTGIPGAGNVHEIAGEIAPRDQRGLRGQRPHCARARRAFHCCGENSPPKPAV